MNFIRKLLGKILYGIGKAISIILDLIIIIVDFLVTIVIKVGKGIVSLLGLGGCLFLTLLGPFSIALLLNPISIIIIAILVLVPILGTKLVSYLKYIKYMITEYLFDHAENLINGRKGQSKTLNEYGKKYKKMEEDSRRREQQERQAAQQRMWEEKFRQWYEFQQSQAGSNYYQGYGSQTYVNPSIEFKNTYEKSCDLLEVDYNADIYQIKLAYRKKAKKYHPDINQSPDATKVFQEINNAYEFLNAENIERYKKLK